MSFNYNINDYTLSIDISGLNINQIDITTLSSVLPSYYITTSGFIEYTPSNYNLTISDILFTSNFINVDFNYYTMTISSYLSFLTLSSYYIAPSFNYLTLSNYYINDSLYVDNKTYFNNINTNLNFINSYFSNVSISSTISGVINYKIYKSSFDTISGYVYSMINNNIYYNNYLLSLSGNINTYNNQNDQINNYQNLFMVSLSSVVNSNNYFYGNQMNISNNINNYQNLFMVSLSSVINSNNYFYGNQTNISNNINNYQNLFIVSLSSVVNSNYYLQQNQINNLINNGVDQYSRLGFLSLSGFVNSNYYYQSNQNNLINNSNNYQDLFMVTLSNIVNNYYYYQGSLFTLRAPKANPVFTGNMQVDGYIRWPVNDMKIETRITTDNNRSGMCLDNTRLRIYASQFDAASVITMGLSTGTNTYLDYLTINHNGDIDITNKINVGSIYVSGLSTFGGNLITTFNINAGNLILTDITDSTSTTTGSLIVKGGCGIGTACNIGGILKIFSTSDINNLSLSYGSIVTNGGIAISKSCNIGSNLNINGICTISGMLNNNGRTKFNNTDESLNFTDASVIMYGGCNIFKNLRVAGSVYSNGDLYSYGTIRSDTRFFINYNLNSVGGAVQTIFNFPGVYIYTFGANYQDTNITCTTFVTFGSGANICRLYNSNIPAGFNLTLTPTGSQTFTISAQYPAGGYNYLSVDFVRLSGA